MNMNMCQMRSLPWYNLHLFHQPSFERSACCPTKKLRGSQEILKSKQNGKTPLGWSGCTKFCLLKQGRNVLHLKACAKAVEAMEGRPIAEIPWPCQIPNCRWAVVDSINCYLLILVGWLHNSIIGQTKSSLKTWFEWFGWLNTPKLNRTIDKGTGTWIGWFGLFPIANASDS